MAEATLTVRVKAIDEASPVINRVKRGAASLGAGMGKSASFLQSPLGAGLAGGALGGGVVALASALQGMMSQVVDIAKRIFSVLVESSGILTQVSKMWHAAIMEVFRPIGDMLGLAMMPAMIDLNKTTASTYAEFLQNVRNGMDINEALAIATDENTAALSEFITSVIPAFEMAMGPLTDLVTTMITTMGPAIADALGQAAPSIGAAFYQAFAQPGIGGILEGLGLEPNAGADWLANDPWGHSTIGQWWNGLTVGGAGIANERYGTVASAGTSGFTINYYGNVYGNEDIETTVARAFDANTTKLQGVL